MLKIIPRLALIFTLVLLVFLFPKPAHAAYTVSGQVVDNRTGNGIPGHVNGNVYIYADATSTGARAYPDSGGNWQLTLPDGQHSVEIANAGSFGWAPISPEKVTVTGPQTITFKIIMGGYDVVGRVVDQGSGRGVPNVLIYSDFPGNNQTSTDYNGNYRITNLRYGGAGHTIYVRPDDGWVVSQDYQVVNPSSPQTEVNVNFTLRGAPVYPYPYPYPTPYSYPSPYTYPTPSYTYPTPYSYPYPTPSYAYPTPAYSYPYPSPYSYPTPSSGFAYCRLDVSPTSGNVSFYSNFNGTFYNSSGASYTPNRYRFYLGSERRSVASSQFSESISWQITNPGSYSTRLEVRHSGGDTVTCFGPTITAFQSGPSYTYPSPYTYPTPYSYPTPGTSYAYPYPTPRYSYGQGIEPITSGFGALLALNPNPTPGTSYAYIAQLPGEENATGTNGQTAWLGTAFEPIRRLFSQIFKI